MYLFYKLCTNLHVSNSLFVHHQECTNHAKHGLYRAAEYCKSWTPDDERNGRSKHVESYKVCRINTYRKCILLVFLYNRLRCAVYSASNSSNLFMKWYTFQNRNLFWCTPYMGLRVVIYKHFCVLICRFWLLITEANVRTTSYAELSFLGNGKDKGKSNKSKGHPKPSMKVLGVSRSVALRFH